MALIQRQTLFRSPGRFAGWPANYGMWRWGSEVVLIFIAGWTGPLNSIHARDVTRPFPPVLARSLDGGATWQLEAFTGRVPGGVTTLSGDEHVQEHLRAATGLADADFVPLDEPLDFLDPETTVLCARTDLASGSVSWFYASHDRCHTWTGPHRLPTFDRAGVSARTDVVALGHRDALFLLSGTKPDGGEGWAFCTRTRDGGRTFDGAVPIGAEPGGWRIMPSSVRLPSSRVLTAVRSAEPHPSTGDLVHGVELYASDDDGATWSQLARLVPSTGAHGNPPALVRLSDGTLVIHYGFRDAPCGLRAVVSRDDGRTWSKPLVLTDDTASLDMGYPRAVVLDDDSILVAMYSNDDPDTERFIELVHWSVDAPVGAA